MSDSPHDTLTVRTVDEMIQEFKDKRGNYAFLIGAGTSAPAGIDTAGVLIDQWKDEKYELVNSDTDKDEWLEQKYEEFQEWIANGEFRDKNSEYGFWFSKRHPTRESRRQFIRNLVFDKEPKFGHIVLAAMMEGENAFVPHALTPNFDDLLYDAFYRYFKGRPLLINHDSIVPQFQLTQERATIIKLHGDYLYDNLQNLDTSKLKENMGDALTRTLREYGLIVLGYSGRDDSIMNVLKDDGNTSNFGVWWCTRDIDGLSEDAQAALAEPNRFVVEIDGSESLFNRFYEEIKNEPGFSIPEYDEILSRAEKRAEELPKKTQEAREEADEGEEQALESLSHRQRGDIYKREEHYEEAIDEFTKAIDQDPEDKFAFNNRGNAYGDLGEYERAIEDYDKAIDLDSEYAVAYNNRGNAYGELGEYERAIEDYDKAIDFDPKYAVAYSNRGNAYGDLGEQERAIEDYDKAIDLDPEYDFAFNNRGNAYSELGEYERAIEDYDKAIGLDPKYAVAYSNRGNAYGELGEHERAIEEYDKAIDLDPEYAVAYNNRGNAYSELGEYERAIEDYDKAIDLEESYSVAISNRAEVHLEIEEYEQARDDAAEAYELAKDTMYVAESLMLILISNTVLDKATDELEQEYREVCNDDITTTWDFTKLNEWLNETDLDSEKEEYIREIMDLLKDHK